jgi:hypothetical protein
MYCWVQLARLIDVNNEIHTVSLPMAEDEPRYGKKREIKKEKTHDSNIK